MTANLSIIWRKKWAILLVGLAYYVMAEITDFGFGTMAVWPAAGVALVGMLFFGPVVGIGIFVASSGAMLSHYAFGYDDGLTRERVIFSFFVGIGNTLGTYVAYLIRPNHLFEFHSFRHFYTRVFRFFGAAIASTVISGVIGLSAYEYFYKPLEVGVINAIAGWVISHLIGILVFVPLVYYARTEGQRRLQSLLTVETLLLLTTILTGVYFLAGPGYETISHVFMHPTLLFIPLLWIVFRKPPLTVSFYNIVICLMVWIGTLNGHGYYAYNYPNGSETAMLLSLSMIFSITLVLDASLVQWRKEFEFHAEKLERKVQERTEELRVAKEEAEALARTDPMTKMNNRRAFYSLGNQIQKEAQRFSKGYSIIMLDIDHFKNINDTYGHDIGDKAIIALAEAMKSAVRDVDVAGRLGGEEFAIILPITGTDEAKHLAERIRKLVHMIEIEVGAQTFGYTVSMGIAQYSEKHPDLEAVLRRADEALYSAKDNGRDRIEVL